MSRRSNAVRYGLFEPSYFSRPSRGIAGLKLFERRFIPGDVGQKSEGAVILSFEKSSEHAAASHGGAENNGSGKVAPAR